MRELLRPPSTPYLPPHHPVLLKLVLGSHGTSRRCAKFLFYIHKRRKSSPPLPLGKFSSRPLSKSYLICPEVCPICAKTYRWICLSEIVPSDLEDSMIDRGSDIDLEISIFVAHILFSERFVNSTLKLVKELEQ